MTKTRRIIFGSAVLGFTIAAAFGLVPAEAANGLRRANGL